MDKNDSIKNKELAKNEDHRPDLNFQELDFDKLDLSGPKFEAFKRRQRSILLNHMSKTEAKRMKMFNKRFKFAVKTSIQAYCVFAVINTGVFAWYWFELDINKFNPKIGRYITHRFG